LRPAEADPKPRSCAAATGRATRPAACHDILHFSDEYSTPGTSPPLAPAARFRHDGGMNPTRRQRTYDHRLVLLVQQTRDVTIATRVGVPQSTVAGWLRRTPRPVTSAPLADISYAALQRRVARLETRCRRLTAVLRVLFVLLKVVKADLGHVRFADADKARILRAIDRTRGVLGLRRILSALRLSPSRFHAWRRAEQGCLLEDQPSCPISSPQRLTPAEVMGIRRMLVSEDMRHVPTGCLALLAQREVG
jgi:putative transposase